MAKWNEITSDQDLAEFLKLYDEFHDCCLKELRYISGAYVKQDLAMYPINDQRKLFVLFQRQNEKNSVVELEFSALEILNLNPYNQLYTCEILEASMFFENGKVYWGDSSDFKNQKELYEGTWLCAENVRWRFVDEYIGEQVIY